MTKAFEISYAIVLAMYLLSSASLILSVMRRYRQAIVCSSRINIEVVNTLLIHSNFKNLATDSQDANVSIVHS